MEPAGSTRRAGAGLPVVQNGLNQAVGDDSIEKVPYKKRDGQAPTRRLGSEPHDNAVVDLHAVLAQHRGDPVGGLG